MARRLKVDESHTAAADNRPAANPDRATIIQLRYEELQLAAARGDRGALNELLIWHYDRLRNFVERHWPAALHGRLETDDLLQETYVRAIRGIATFDPAANGSFESWLLTIAHHTMQSVAEAVMAQKRGGHFQQIGPRKGSFTSSLGDLLTMLVAKDATGSTKAATKEAIEALEEHIADLPAEHRQAVQLRYLRGRSLAETATALDRSPDAVRGLLYRAKQRLREALGRSSRWFGR